MKSLRTLFHPSHSSSGNPFERLRSKLFLSQRVSTHSDKYLQLTLSAHDSTLREATEQVVRRAVRLAHEQLAASSSRKENITDTLVQAAVVRKQIVRTYRTANGSFWVVAHVTLCLPVLIEPYPADTQTDKRAGLPLFRQIQLKTLKTESERIVLEEMETLCHTMKTPLFDFSIAFEPVVESTGHYVLKAVVRQHYTDTCRELVRLLWDILSVLNLPKKAYETYKQTNQPVYTYSFPQGSHLYLKTDPYTQLSYHAPKFHLQSPFQFDMLAFLEEQSRFQINDNLNQPTRFETDILQTDDHLSHIFPYCIVGKKKLKEFSNTVCYELKKCKPLKKGTCIRTTEINIHIPKSEVTNHLSFSVAPA